MNGTDSVTVELLTETVTALKGIKLSLSVLVFVAWLTLLFKDCNGASAIRELIKEIKRTGGRG